MAWHRHTRNLTHKVFYDGTTIDGSRLEKGLGEIEDGFNDVARGNVRKRFVQTQYHAGFNPANRRGLAPGAALADNHHSFPWLPIKNSTAFPTGTFPTGAPFNILRLKGTSVPGIHTFGPSVAQSGEQYAWTRCFYFSRPVIIHAVSVMMQIDGGANTERPYTGTADPAISTAYTYSNAWGGGQPAAGIPINGPSIDVPIVLDVMNPGSPEDAELTDIEYVRSRWVVNESMSSHAEPDPGPVVTWNDFSPEFSSGAPPGGIDDVRPLLGRVVEHRDLNIPVHEQARVRLAIVIPYYPPAVGNTWQDVPWYLQAWSVTLTVLEEVRPA